MPRGTLERKQRARRRAIQSARHNRAGNRCSRSRTANSRALGRRIRKTVNGTKTLYVHDGEHIVQELNAAEAVQATFRYGPGLDQPLTMERGGQTYWYLNDSLGSIVALTDAAGGIVEKYVYDAFGETKIFDGTGSPLTTSAFGNPWMFTGRQLDPETGLYHYRARAFSPAIGRFLQRDPLDQLPDTNVYRYVENQPLDLIDPFGLMSENCSGAHTPGRRSWLRFDLDLAGLIPGIGTPFKLIDSALCFAENDYVGGLLSLNAAVPFVGWPAGVMKVIRTVKKATDIADSGKVSRGGPRPQSERIADFQNSPQNWERTSASGERATGRKAKEGVSVESEYTNKVTGETIHVHDVFKPSGKHTPNHLTYRDYAKGGH